MHELAHIRRGDYLANVFQLFAEALLFFNPAVWWISHQVRREREACCDALATELSGTATDYARTLVRVAENVLNPPPVAAPAFGDRRREPSSLNDRVQRLLAPGYRPALEVIPVQGSHLIRKPPVGGTTNGLEDSTALQDDKLQPQDLRNTVVPGSRFPTQWACSPSHIS